MNQPQNSDQADWFLRHANQDPSGPFPFNAIVVAAQQGKIVDGTQLQHPALTNGQWVPASSIPAIAMAMPQASAAAAPAVPPSPAVVIADAASSASAAQELRARRQRERKRSTWGTIRFVGSLILIAAPSIYLLQSPFVRDAVFGKTSVAVKRPIEPAPVPQPPRPEENKAEPTKTDVSPQESPDEDRPANIPRLRPQRVPVDTPAESRTPTARESSEVPDADTSMSGDSASDPGRESQFNSENSIRPPGIEPRSLSGFGRSNPGDSLALPLPDQLVIGVDLSSPTSRVPLNFRVRPNQIELEDVIGPLVTALWQIRAGTMRPDRDTFVSLQSFGTHQFGLNLTCQIRLSEPVEDQDSFLHCSWTWQPRVNGKQVPFSMKEMIAVRSQIDAQVKSLQANLETAEVRKKSLASFLEDGRQRTLEAHNQARQQHAVLKKNIGDMQSSKFKLDRVLRDFDSFARFAKELSDRGSFRIRVVK